MEAGRAFSEQEWSAALHESRAFHDPSSLQRMLAAYAVEPNSLITPATRELHAAAAAQAQHLRVASDSAWAAEAVRRGVAHARSGDHAAALRCYDRALELVPLCVDALVAKGAALASLGRLQEGKNACSAALQADPSHSNAAAYLASIRRKLAEEAPASAAPPVPSATCAVVPPAALEALRSAAAALRKERRKQRDGDKEERRRSKGKRRQRESASGESSSEGRRQV